MRTSTIPTVLITGSTGRIGTLLRAAWTADPPQAFLPLWHTRHAAPPGWLRWDMLSDPCPPVAPAPAILLNLAGVTAAQPQHLGQNAALARVARAAARRFRCRRLFLLSSAAVYGPGTAGHAFAETAPPHPATPYGHAKTAMERAAQDWPATTCLRIGNVVGADGLLSSPDPEIRLDHIAATGTGPSRSWIGPKTLARTFAGLIVAALARRPLPRVLNVAQSPALPMEAVLDAAGRRWRFAPATADTVAHVALDAARLARIVPLPAASPHGLLAELRDLIPA